MTGARLHSVTARGADRYEITFELLNGQTYTFACRVVDADAGLVTVWETRFDELVGGRDMHLKYELSWLVSCVHLVRQMAWDCPPAMATPRPSAGRRTMMRTRAGRRPTYSPQLQADAVEMVQTGEYTGGEVADAAGCSVRQLRRWRRRVEATEAEVGGSPQAAEASQVERATERTGRMDPGPPPVPSVTSSGSLR